MTHATDGVETPNSARFVFDPLHRPDGTPSFEALREWAIARMDDPSTPIGAVVGSTAEALPSRSWAGILRDLLPGGRSRRMERAAQACLVHLVDEARRCHDAVREFGVDPRSHALLSDAMERVLATACFLVQEENARRLIAEGAEDALTRTLSRIMDDIDVRRSIEKGRVAMREMLEIEALTNIVNASDRPEDRPRIIAGLRAALDEIVGPETHANLKAALSRVDGNDRGR